MVCRSAPPARLSPLQTSKIHTLWVGPRLSVLEQLCLTSFLHHGHDVDLYTYEDVGDVPQGVTIRDASQILSRDYLFSYGQKVGGARSPAGFANWFRAELLLKQGGTWVDTDVVCLRPFAFEQPLVCGFEDDKYACNAVLGLSSGHEIADVLAQGSRAPDTVWPWDDRKKRWKKFRSRIRYWGRAGDRRARMRWGEAGGQLLTSALKFYGHADDVLPPSAFYPIHYADFHHAFEERFTDAVHAASQSSYAVHLWNEMMRLKKFDKEAQYPRNCFFEQMKRRYL